jgi:hypothetical protein
MKPDAIFQAIGDFCESGPETLFKGSAAVLFEGFLGNEEGDNFAFRNFDAGKTRDGLSVNEAKVKLVVLNGHAHAIPHEIDITLDGFGGDLQFVGELAAIGKCAGFEAFVKAHHALQWRAGLDACPALWGKTDWGGTRHVHGISSTGE